MSTPWECIGGPLDGRTVACGEAFPYPEGWYYLRSRLPLNTWVYEWSPEGFIPTDRAAVPPFLLTDAR